MRWTSANCPEFRNEKLILRLEFRSSPIWIRIVQFPNEFSLNKIIPKGFCSRKNFASVGDIAFPSWNSILCLSCVSSVNCICLFYLITDFLWSIPWYSIINNSFRYSLVRLHKLGECESDESTRALPTSMKMFDENVIQMCVNKAKNLTIIITTKTIIPYRWEKSARSLARCCCITMTIIFGGGRSWGLQHVQHTKRDKTHTSPIDIIIKPPGISLLYVKRRRLINWIIVSFHSPLHVRPTTPDVDYKQKKLSFSGVGGWLRWHS